MRKYRICITVEKSVVDSLKDSMKNGKFRSISHAFEYYAKQGMLRGV